MNKNNKRLMSFFKTQYHYCKVENDNFNMQDFYYYLRNRNDYFLKYIENDFIFFNVINPFNEYMLTIEELEFYISKVKESENVLKMLSKTFKGMEKNERINLESINDRIVWLKCYLMQEYEERKYNNE